MKRIGLMFAAFTIAFSAFSQTECSKSNPLFRFDDQGTPHVVTALGGNPEFPFLKNRSTPGQVAAAMKKDQAARQRSMEHLNALLVEIGFPNGAKDVTASNISPYTIPEGTTGNMADGDFTVRYVKLETSEPGEKAWKITSPTGCYVYLCAKCGNAFYPGSPVSKTACLTVPVTLTGESKEITLGNNANNVTTTNDVYVYYHKKHHWKDAKPGDIPDTNPSDPLLLNTTKKVEAVPQTYKVSVSTPEDRLKVCEDKPAEVATNINVEKISGFSGYYPRKMNKEYKRVSHCVYRKSARKMRKAERKENRVAQLTGVEVNREK